MSAQCKIQVRFCGAGAGTSAVLRKGAVLGNGAGMVRVRFAGAVLVRVKIFAHFGQWFFLEILMALNLCSIERKYDIVNNNES